MDHAWLAPSLTELYGRMAVTFKPIRGALSQFLVWDKAELCLCWQIGWWIADDAHTLARTRVALAVKWEGYWVSIWTVHGDLSFFFFSSRLIFFASTHTGMFSVSIQICLELGFASCLIKPKLLTAGWMNGWTDGWMGSGRAGGCATHRQALISAHPLISLVVLIWIATCGRQWMSTTSVIGFSIEWQPPYVPEQLCRGYNNKPLWEVANENNGIKVHHIITRFSVEISTSPPPLSSSLVILTLQRLHLCLILCLFTLVSTHFYHVNSLKVPVHPTRDLQKPGARVWVSALVFPGFSFLCPAGQLSFTFCVPLSGLPTTKHVAKSLMSLWKCVILRCF